MIKYLEMTAPDSGEFRQAKIISIEVAEGAMVVAGDALFKVKSGDNEIDLPTLLSGKIVEVIAVEGESISAMTPLVLIETEVAESTATIKSKKATAKSTPNSKPVSKSKKQGKKITKKATKKLTKAKAKALPKNTTKITKHQQQQLDLTGSEPVDNSDQQEIIVSKSNQASSNSIQVTVPDIGGDDAKVVEILVKVGDTVAVEDSLVTLESDKASMDVPSSHAGLVSSISVQIDDDVSEGTLIVELSADGAATESEGDIGEEVISKLVDSAPKVASEPVRTEPASTSDGSSIIEVAIPDIGGDMAKVIEILVSVGQEINLEDALVTLESDKASMDVPSSAAGILESIEVSIDQEVGEGTIVAKLLSSAASTTAKTTETAAVAAPAPSSAKTVEKVSAAQQAAAPVTSPDKSHASPSIRRFARELGVDLSKVSGRGRKGRITQEDVKSFVKGVMTTGSSASAPVAGSGIPAIPTQDFTKFGDIDVQPLNRIKRLTATNLSRSWLNVPHVTHNDESNINDLESFRKQLNAEYAKQNKGTKLSPLAFIVKAVVNALQTYPQFNSSLDEAGENLIYKKYFNIGIAVETPNGLVVPVIKGADSMNVTEIATEMGVLAAKARDKKLTGADMSGACFTISSLGGIGGTHFTPIVNAPEVAILGVSKSKMQPVWDGSEFQPGMILPLSLSYDHRVIDGAEAARFTRHIAAVLEDVRRLTI